MKEVEDTADQIQFVYFIHIEIWRNIKSQRWK